MNKPNINTARGLRILLVIGLSIAWAGAKVQATEINADFATGSTEMTGDAAAGDAPVSELPGSEITVSEFTGSELPASKFAASEDAQSGASAAGLTQAEMVADDMATTKWARDARRGSPASLLNAEEAQPSDEATGALGHGESDGDALALDSLATWLPAAVNLPEGNAALVDTFVLAIAALHPTGAVRFVRNTLWELEDLEGTVREADTRPMEIDLKEQDSLAAAEVAFVLGNIESPDSDIIFLAFVALQSLWGLASRPRQT